MKEGKDLDKTFPKRIHIIGSVGSGKTTLAREISSSRNIPYYELDNVVWERDVAGDIRRTEEQRETFLQSIVEKESWIVEGVHQEEWVTQSFCHAHVIVFLDVPYNLRTFRIIKRYILQQLGLEHANYKPSFHIFKKMFQWNKYFEQVGKPNFYQKYDLYTDKLVVVRNKKSLKQLIRSYAYCLNEEGDKYELR